MVDFSNYSALQEDGSEAREFTFHDIEGQPSILSRPATSANKKYNNARLKSLNKRTKGGRAKARISLATVESARREDADMLSKFCVTGWGTPPVDSSGEPVPFSAANCHDFLLAIPDWMFDEYRGWVSDPINFTSDEDESDDDGDEPDTVGESQPSSPSASDGNSDSSETVTQ